MNIWKFPGQWDNEEIKAFLHKHWMDYAPTVVIMLAMSLLPILFFILLPQLFISGNDRDVAAKVFYLLTGMYYLMILAYGMTAWVLYYFDVVILTNIRLLNIEQNGLFSEEVSTLRLEQVQDVSYDRDGIFQTALNYGTTTVQTAGEGQGGGGFPHTHPHHPVSDFRLEMIPRPNELSELVMIMHDAIVAKEQMLEAQEIAKAASLTHPPITPPPTP